MLFKKFNIKNDIYIISAITRQGLEELVKYIQIKLDEIEDITFEHDIEEDFESTNNDDSDYEIEKLNKNTYSVTCGKLKRIASVTDIRNTAQIKRFTNILDSMGVFESLRERGINNGDTVIAAGIEFTYDEEYY